MGTLALKRIIKSKLGSSSPKPSVRKTNGKVSVSLFPVSVFLLFIVIVFSCIVHLGTVSVLSPCGKELNRLNQEKDALIEENRILEQKIAQYMSFSVVTSRAEKELNMEKAEDVIYLDASSVSAEIHSLIEDAH